MNPPMNEDIILSICPVWSNFPNETKPVSQLCEAKLGNPHTKSELARPCIVRNGSQVPHVSSCSKGTDQGVWGVNSAFSISFTRASRGQPTRRSTKAKT